MAPQFWMITDRNVTEEGLGRDKAKNTTYWVSSSGPLMKFGNWSKVSMAGFKAELLKATAAFPPLEDLGAHEDQKHVTVFLHGYNNDWADAAGRYESICKRMFQGDSALGLCILFSWPSDGMKLGYLPDREDARRCAPDVADVFSSFYDWLAMKQLEGAKDPEEACRAKLSVIAHSMGNYVLQKAMQAVWTRKNQPLLVSLINQLVMVAADVDNDLFKSGESQGGTDGDAIANLTYRVTALYTGRDTVLGMSAGIKHFGKRRLGRSGLDRTSPVPDNVWDSDCSSLIGPDESNIHSAYFEEPKTIELMKQVLRGVDRKVLVEHGIAAEGTS